MEVVALVAIPAKAVVHVKAIQKAQELKILIEARVVAVVAVPEWVQIAAVLAEVLQPIHAHQVAPPPETLLPVLLRVAPEDK